MEVISVLVKLQIAVNKDNEYSKEKRLDRGDRLGCCTTLALFKIYRELINDALDEFRGIKIQ